MESEHEVLQPSHAGHVTAHTHLLRCLACVSDNKRHVLNGSESRHGDVPWQAQEQGSCRVVLGNLPHQLPELKLAQGGQVLRVDEVCRAISEQQGCNGKWQWCIALSSNCC